MMLIYLAAHVMNDEARSLSFKVRLLNIFKASALSKAPTIVYSII